MHHHDHDHHNHHNHHDMNRVGNKSGLIIALTLTAAIMIIEFFGGLITNSLALLSDSGHMLSDTSSLTLSLVAMYFATRPASQEKTYGFYRFEILAALFNGVALFVIAGIIIKEAYGRFMHPPMVLSGSMIIIATVGLIANLISAWSLIKKGDTKGNLNVRSAYLHIIGDALGSIGAIIAGLLMYMFKWYIADPIISVIVAILILKSAWGIISHTIHILMEGSPITVKISDVKNILSSMEGVIDVHDLHIWTITSGLDCLSCHMIIEDNLDTQNILQVSIKKIEEEFNIKHSTIQIEKSSIYHSNPLV